jgi:hypothetical protein
MPAKHTHRYEATFRGCRRCRWKSCRHLQYSVGVDDEKHLIWRDAMTVQQFAHKWLPAISGTTPEKMLTVDVAFPFEFNCYESWNVAMRVRFDFTDVLGRRAHGMGTRVDVMNGWRSRWHEDFARIDFDAECYYREITGRDYDIGDNTYEQMRRIIQS